jgi:hypothetical protein
MGGMAIRFSKANQATAFADAFNQRFAKAFNLTAAAPDYDDFPAVFIGSPNEDIESRMSWNNGDGLAEIPFDRRLSISELAKQFDGDWAGGLDNLAEELMSETSELGMLQCFEDSGLPNEGKWLALEQAHQMMQRWRRVELDRFRLFRQAYRDMLATKS